MEESTMSKIGDALANQFERIWMQVRPAIENCPNAEWRRGDHPAFIPVRLACHLVETVDYYAQPTPESFPGAGWGDVDWESGDVNALPDRDALLAYMEEVRGRVDAWLRGLSDEELLGGNAFPWTGDSPMERMVYTLRHSQHHLAEINEELTRRGLPPAGWR